MTNGEDHRLIGSNLSGNSNIIIYQNWIIFLKYTPINIYLSTEYNKRLDSVYLLCPQSSLLYRNPGQKNVKAP